MKDLILKLLCLTLIGTTISCGNNGKNSRGGDEKGSTADSLSSPNEYGSSIVPSETSSSHNKFAKVIGWKKDNSPTARSGFKVVRFAQELNSPRKIYVAPNGDIFVAQSRTEQTGESNSPNEIIRFTDSNNDGVAESKEVFLSGLSQPYGMLILDSYFYVANTDGLLRFPYDAGTGKVEPKPEKILSLPAGGYNNHWTRNLTMNKDGSKIYITVGSGSNVGENGMEHEKRRAAILEVDPDGKNERLFASGIRNPVGMDWEPSTGALWTAVNERDELGDELVPDYITAVQEGGFYGWPYTYWGNNTDPRWVGETPDSLVNNSITPDYAIGAHTASLGITFSSSDTFEKGAYISQHGSWNRSKFSGYKVIFVPFDGGKPSGQPVDFLTGFISNEATDEVHGRPVDVAFTDSYLLVTDDAANTIWAVLPE